MNKQLLLEQILIKLESLRQQAIAAAMQAYNTATAEENVAENKYDTLGLEAAYLAQGQAKRVVECEEDIAAFKSLSVERFKEQRSISMGALIQIEDEHEVEQFLFLGPKAGGLSFMCADDGFDKKIRIITPSSPIGAALLKREVGEEFELKVGGNTHFYEIMSVC